MPESVDRIDGQTVVSDIISYRNGKEVSFMENLVQGIFQGLPVKAPHSPVALPFHPDEQAGTGS